MHNTPSPSQQDFGLGEEKPRGTLGTFLGVFTPTILTILGVIMYLRFGWVVGQVGLPRSLLIVVLANAITLATSLCLAAVTTNRRVGVGGAYYIISRSLGLEIGGAIGLPLFFSQALSVTLYAFGLAESLRFVWPIVPVAPIAIGIILLVFLLARKGAGVALQSQIPIMALIAISLLALAIGVFSKPMVTSQTVSAPIILLPFWAVFAVFFPAVTGVIAGLSMSGDLAAPRQAIPRGTLLATLAGFVIYILVPLLLHFGADRSSLLNEPLVWTKIAILGPWLILPGLWGRNFSSAVGSMLGAPRTLQALAHDRLMPQFFCRGQGEPIAGLILTLIISITAVFLGDLNTVATVVTMFFLSVYGTINLVASLGQLSGNPSWRPTITVHWSIGLTGFSGCLLVMLLIHWPSTLIALLLEFAIWLWFKHHIRNTSSLGDLRRDIFEALTCWGLVRLNRYPMTARNWRPHFLVFVRNLEQRLDLVRFASWFNEDRGMTTVSELIEGDILDVKLDILARQQQMAEILHREGLEVFGVVNIVDEVERGILTIAQATGLAALESNTILVGFPDEVERLALFLRVLRQLGHLQRSLVIGKIEPLSPAREGIPRTLHIWWGGLKRNGDLMLLLSYLLTCNAEWRHARIHIMSVASSEIMQQQTEAALAKLLPEIRIQADVEVMQRQKSDNIIEIIRQKSFAADVVFLGLATPEEGKELEYANRVKNMVECLPTCFLVHNGSLFIGDLVLQDEM